MKTILKQVTDAAKLISLPETYLKLKSLLDEPDFAMAEVAILVSQDPGLTVRLLKLVNSSLYRRSAKIETVSHAVSIIGTQQIHDLVLATCVAQVFDGLSSEVMTMKQFWQHSVNCALNVRQLSSIYNPLLGERLFVCGLLHDIGHLVMYQTIPDKCQQAIETSLKHEIPLYRVERELFGFDYAHLGGSIMDKWGLPASIYEPVQCHVEPQLAREYPLEAYLVYLGWKLSQAVEDEGIFDQGSMEVEQAAWTATKLTAEQCLIVKEKSSLQTREMLDVLFG